MTNPASQWAAEAFAVGIAPPARATVADYAAAHRWLMNEGGGHVGRWEHDLVPYIVAPMEALTEPDVTTVALVGPGQSAKSSVWENWLLYSVATDPASMLIYMQTEPALEAFAKTRINPMIERHDEMRSRIGLRPIDDSLHFKRFRGMWVEFLSATYSNLISKSAPRIAADEIDAYPTSLGNVRGLLDIRRQTFGSDSMLFMLSHPDLATGLDPVKDWKNGIMAVYADSDRRKWYWPCPVCGGWSSPVPTAERVMVLDYPASGSLDEIEASARLICPCNGCVIEDRHRHGMNRLAFRSPFGGWIGEGQEIAEDGTITGDRVKSRTAGFWIVGAMVPFVTIGSLARARVEAEREVEVTGEDKSLHAVMSKKWGVPYSAPRSLGSLDAETIAATADPRLRLGVVPVDARFLTAFADVQGDRFEVLVRGWGSGGQSWVVDFFKVEKAAPATVAEDWDRLIPLLINRAYPLAGMPNRAMKIRGIGFDSSGEPGVTTQAGDFWLRLRARRALRLLNRVGGRDVWNVIPMKGANGFDAPRLAVTYPDTQRKGKLAAHGSVPQLAFNPNLFKDDLNAQLQTMGGLPWSIHFPMELRGEKPPHAFFEQLVAEKRNRKGQWAKEHSGIRNEALDLMVGTHALARLHGIGRIDWEKPPMWAAPLDVNSAVIDMTPETVAVTVPVTLKRDEPLLGPRITVIGEEKKPVKISDRLA